MKKNVASQTIGAQMITASDGSAFTGSVTCYVTGDGGTQALGSVGSGVCTHEGNGLHTYAPAQAETNYDFAEFTFIGTGAIPATVHVYTGFPQTVDNDTKIQAIQTDLDNGTDGLGAIKTAVDGISAGTSPLILQSTTIATLASQVSFTLTAGSADDDAYNGCIAVVTDQSASTQKAVGYVSDYVGSTRTVTLVVDPGVFTMATGDSISILVSLDAIVFPELSQGIPAINERISYMNRFLYHALLNENIIDDTAGTHVIRNNADSQNLFQATVSKTATTTTKEKFVSGT